jgi:hypothetical protein
MAVSCLSVIRTWIDKEFKLFNKHHQRMQALLTLLRLRIMRVAFLCLTNDKFWKQLPPLSWLLEIGKDNQATDSRDLIFGVLGIADPSHQLQVDYHLTVEEVYTTAFQNMLQSEGSLNVLRFVTGEVLQEDSNRSLISHVELPSWVPDLPLWNNYSTAVTIQTKGIMTNLAGNHYIHAASGKYDLESKTEFDFKDHGRTLLLVL